MSKSAAARTALQDELNGKIKAVLSGEQKKKYDELLAGRGGRRGRTGAGAIQAALRQVDLTEAEKATTGAIVAKTQKAAEGKSRAERTELWSKAVEDIKKVLGPKRAEKFAQIMRDPNARARARAAFRGIELTEAQVDQIVKIQAEYREKLDSVLTEEQKAKLRTLRTPRGGGARVRGDRGAAREGALDRPRGRNRERARPDAPAED
jgi:Spy/CpxP family protein refolding chaperone